MSETGVAVEVNGNGDGIAKHFNVLSDPFDQIERKVNIMLLMGQLLQESGAMTSRIYRDIVRMAAYMGIPEKMLHVHIMYTGIMINISDGKNAYTAFNKFFNHVVNMANVSDISNLSWKIFKEKYDLDELERKVQSYKKRPMYYSPWTVVISVCLAGCGSSLVFGSDLVSALYTMIAVGVGFESRKYFSKLEINKYASITLASFLATSVAYLVTLLPIYTATPWCPMISCCLFIVPGVPLINGVNDMVNGFTSSGMCRLTDTVLICCSVIFGTICAINICGVPDFLHMIYNTEFNMELFFIGAAMTAGGYAVMFNTKPRLLPIVALGGALAVGIRVFFTYEIGLSQIMAAMLASTAISAIAMLISGRLRVPMHVVIFPSLIPLIPGPLLYRLYFAIINIGDVNPVELLPAVSSGIEAFLIIIGTAVGAAMPHIILHRHINQKNQLHLEEMIYEMMKQNKKVAV